MSDKRRKRRGVLTGILCAALLAIALPVSTKAAEPQRYEVTPTNLLTLVSRGIFSYDPETGVVGLGAKAKEGTIFDFSGTFAPNPVAKITMIKLDKECTITSSKKDAKVSQLCFSIDAPVTIENLTISCDESASSSLKSSLGLFMIGNIRIKSKQAGDKADTQALQTVSGNGPVVFRNNKISYTTNATQGGCAFLSFGRDLELENNEVTFKGNSNGSSVSALVTLAGDLRATGNKFTIEMPSVKAARGATLGSSVAAIEVYGGFAEFSKNTVDLTVTGVVEGKGSALLSAAPETEEFLEAETAPKTKSMETVTAMMLLDPGLLERTEAFASLAEGKTKTEKTAIVTENTIRIHKGRGVVSGIYMISSDFDVCKNEIEGESDSIVMGIVQQTAEYTMGHEEEAATASASASVNIKENVIKSDSPLSSAITLASRGSEFERNINYQIERNTISAQGDYLGGIMSIGSGKFSISANTIDVPGTNSGKFPELISTSMPATSCGIMIRKYRDTFGFAPIPAEEGALIKDNQITSSDIGILISEPAMITGNNIKTEGTYTVQAYDTEMPLFASTSYAEDGEATLELNYLAKVVGNTLKAKEFVGDKSVLFDEDVVLVKDNGTYVEPKKDEPAEEPAKEKESEADPAPVQPVVKTTVTLKAAKKTFKAAVKTKKYTVTLKTKDKKAVAGVKLTLKIGKKTYKATTNKKGKATFKIKKLTKKGTYKATVKFAGGDTYEAVSKKTSIKVK